MKVILYTIEWKRKVQEKDGSGGGHTGTVAEKTNANDDVVDDMDMM